MTKAEMTLLQRAEGYRGQLKALLDRGQDDWTIAQMALLASDRYAEAANAIQARIQKGKP